MEKIAFMPIRGSENSIMGTPYTEGAIYFSTDTKKIFMDANNLSKIPMGGNSAFYYGKMVFQETPDTDQTEFIFNTWTDLEINSDDEKAITIPNVGDLIINIPDGGFYQVINNFDKERIVTHRIAISGTGGSGGSDKPGDSAKGSITFNRITAQEVTVAYQKSFSIEFYVSAVDSTGETTGNGTYILYVSGSKAKEGIITQGKNSIEIDKFLALGTNQVRIDISMDIGGSSAETIHKNWTIHTTQLELKWELDPTEVYSTVEDLTLNWNIVGAKDYKKTTHIIINDVHDITTDTTSITIKPSEYGLIHGAHKIEMYATTTIDKIDIETPHHIIKRLIFAEENNVSQIVAIDFFNEKLQQYDTVEIPFRIYSSRNTAGTETVTFLENNRFKGSCSNCSNGISYKWVYTPTVSGIQILTFQCGITNQDFTVNITPLDVPITEVSDRTFSFKPGDFANNESAINWNDNNITASFSDDFDWINGGLKLEDDGTGDVKQSIYIKAGSSMTINYPLFKKSAKSKGKSMKIIFKTSNCRDYDAQFLSCKRDRQRIEIDEDLETFLVIEENTFLNCSKNVQINNNKIELVDAENKVFDINTTDGRELFDGRYIEFENTIYLCNIKEVEGTKDNPQYYAVFFEPKIKDSFEGILMTAQNATFNSRNQTLSTQYCEDSYIELELDINPQDNKKNTNYITFWIDGVPSGYTIYDASDSFIDDTEQFITIGSSNCDIQIYLIKVYEKHLTDNEHLQNFIVDAPNAAEMIARYKRNNILDEREEISPTLLALANPDCLVHVYKISRMTKTKKDKVKNCTYSQYHNSDSAHLTAEGVTIKVQGTSSEKYVVAAANLDTEFENGFINTTTGQHIDGWSMSENSIPINFTCTKVNVASCENANNVLNQEWYNLFQPYKTIVRCKDKKARDCMEFTNGVIFMQDNNPTFTLTGTYDAKDNNIFGDTPGYLSDPYPKFYSLGQMGNSKKNIEVFHDTKNPLECCIEVTDNQAPQQWMVNDYYSDTDIDDNEKYFGFRYPDGAGNANQDMMNNWRRLVSWMAHNNPQPKYEKHENITTEKQYKAFAFNQKKNEKIPVFILNSEKTAYIPQENFDINIQTYYTETPHIYGYTDLPLEESETYTPYVFKGYKANEEIQKNYEPLIKGCKEDTYAGTYTTDCYERRMAKMLKECEDYLVMDSIIYHFLFIERHCMIDNVAKNTFWSTEDGNVWNLTKNYDNDTADGNDNNGKFTRTYGMEPLDKLNKNVYVFNAHRSVWFNFINGLKKACEHMYQQLENVTENIHGREVKLWNKDDYLWLFKEWQSRIPERCWIEDYYRKYHRPYEIYKDTMYNSMMEGGQKVHQRKQYETYQDIYISSKYFGSTCSAAYSIIRGNGSGLKGHKLPVTTYSDCYVHAHVGASRSVQKIKRNEINYLICPVDNINNATVYFYPQNIFSTLGSTDLNEGKIGDYEPDQLTFSGAKKLREFIASNESTTSNESLKTGLDVSGNPLLEKLYIANFTKYADKLDLTDCPNLKEVNAAKSTFTSISFADNAPLEKIKIHNPTSLSMSNLKFVTDFTINDFNRLSILDINNIDNSPGVNSKDIVKNSIALENYKLTNIKWTISDSNEITSTTIPILEKLLGKKPIESEDGYEPQELCLSGKIIVKESAYNSSNATNIYNKYAQKDVYPLLDIEFEGNDAKLHMVNILDGNNNVAWSRRIANNTEITTDFLSKGPSGAFDIGIIYRSPTISHIYTFNGEWEVWANGTQIGTISNSNFGSYGNITTDITFKPVFVEEDRQYTITVLDGDGTNLLEPTLFKYATTLSEIKEKITAIPYKDDSQLSGLTETYVFKGYGLLPTSTTPITENYIVTNDQILYPIFEKIDDVHTVVNYDWYEYAEAKIDNISGYQISPIKTLKGKITIPASYNGIPIISIAGFNAPSAIGTQDFTSPHKITHVFFQENSILKRVNNNAFNNVITLKYFEFNKNTITTIGNYSFRKCPLINTALSEVLEEVGVLAFNQAFSSTQATTIYIPSSLHTIYDRGFAVLKVAKGSNLIIGSPEKLSKLDLGKVASSKDSLRLFVQNSGTFTNAIFYTEKYTSINDEIFNPAGTENIGTVGSAFEGIENVSITKGE